MRMAMSYPSGLEILKGDLIWWDEGLQIGYVRQVCPNDLTNQAESHIVVGSPPYHASNIEGLVLPQSLFVDEGLSKLSVSEAKEYFCAKELAFERFDNPVVGSYRVNVFYENEEVASWHFWFNGPLRKEVVVKRGDRE